jgi:hypothetical protein
MKKFSVLNAIVALLFLAACSGQPGIDENVELIDNEEEFTAEMFLPPDSMASANNKIDKNRPEDDVVQETLPPSYTMRLFVDGGPSVQYDVSKWAGIIVKKDPSTNKYQKVSLAVIKGNRPPVINNMTNGEGHIYSTLLTNSYNINGSVVIGGISCEVGKMLELVIQDVSIASVPDSLIDVERIKKLKEKIKGEELKNYYYVQSATLTVINHKKYSKTKFDASVNCSYITLGGKTFQSFEKFQTERVISIDQPIPLEEFLETVK